MVRGEPPISFESLRLEVIEIAAEMEISVEFQDKEMFSNTFDRLVKLAESLVEDA